MKLRQLTIHNIASIEDACIDFSQAPLSDSEVFLITGKTGSGKSTILDAICLALYNNTPRLINQSAKVNENGTDKLAPRSPLNLLRRNTAEGYISLLFEGNNGVQYEAKWGAYRARKKIDGTIQKKSWSLTNIDDRRTFDNDDDIEAEIKEAVGLDFSQFCRTTLLAQGEFTKFLQSTDDEKAAILEKITGVDIYSKIGQKIYKKYDDIKKQYTDLQQKAGNLIPMPEAEEKQLKEQLEQLNVDSAAQQKAAEQAAKAAEHYRAITTAEQEIARQETAIRQLYEEYSRILAGEQHILHLKKTTAEQIQQTDIALQAQADKAAVYQAQPAIAAHIANILSSQQQRTQYEAEQANQQKQLEQKSALLEQAKEQLHAAEQKLKQHLLQHQALSEQLEKASLPEKRQQAQKQLEAKNAATRLLDKTHQITTANDQLTLKRKQQEKLSNTINDLLAQKQTAVTAQEQAKDALNKAEIKKQVWEETAGKWAKTMRQKLQVGDICPLCRQEIKQLEMEELIDENYQKAVNEYQEAKKAADDATQQLSRIEANISSNKTALSNKEEEIQQSTQHLTQLQQECQQACEACHIPYADDMATTQSHIQASIKQIESLLEQLRSDISAGENLEHQLRESNDQRQQLQNKKDDKNQILTDTNKLIGDIHTQITNSQARAEECVRTITNASNEIEQLVGDTTWQHDWHTAPEAFDNELKEATEQYQQNVNIVAQLRQRQQQIDTTLSAIQGQTTTLLQLQPLWADAPIPAPQHVADIQTRVNNLVSNLQTAMNRQKDAQSDKEKATQLYTDYITHHPLEDDTPVEQQLLARNSEAKQQVEGINQTIGSITTQLKNNDEKRQSSAAIEAEMKRLEAPKAMWEKLCNRMGLGSSDGKNFRRIAQSYVLNSLVNAANKYLAMLTDSRYRLTINLGSFLILIEDARQAGTTRFTGTISGGESFLVSLSLALALSDIGTLSVDTLFIDEGFGSLSGEALDNAINTLYSLQRTCGRRVGIISHIEDLRERIPVKIQVEQQPNSSSSQISVVS